MEDKSGKIKLRTSPEIHQRLVDISREQGVSLNLLLNQMVTFSIGVLYTKDKQTNLGRITNDYNNNER